MLTYKDKTFCASPNCKNECGRKLTEDERNQANRQHLHICFAYFCDVPDKIFPEIPREFQARMKR